MNSKQRDRVIGLLFLSAFPLYGGGAALFDSDSSQFTLTYALALSLLLANSLVVIIIGRMLQQRVVVVARSSSSHYQSEIAAHVYFFARVLEAILLAIAGCITYRYNVSAGDTTATSTIVVSPYYYDVAMIGLGIGSLPLLITLMRTKLIPNCLGWFGLVAYALLACGNATSAMSIADADNDENLAMTLQYPGAIFELSFAIWLIVSGFVIDNDNYNDNDSSYDGTNESTQLLKN